MVLLLVSTSSFRYFVLSRSTCPTEQIARYSSDNISDNVIVRSFEKQKLINLLNFHQDGTMAILVWCKQNVDRTLERHRKRVSGELYQNFLTHEVFLLNFKLNQERLCRVKPSFLFLRRDYVGTEWENTLSEAKPEILDFPNVFFLSLKAVNTRIDPVVSHFSSTYPKFHLDTPYHILRSTRQGKTR